MNRIFKASIRTGGNDRVEWYWDTREQASEFINQVIRERKRLGQYCSSPRIQSVEVAACETAFDYNYPDIPRIISERRKS